MEYRNEVLDRLIGTAILIQYKSGPRPEFSYPAEEQEERIIDLYETPGKGYERDAKYRISVYELVSYDSIGIVVRSLEEGSVNEFKPWGAIINIDFVTEEAERTGES